MIFSILNSFNWRCASKIYFIERKWKLKLNKPPLNKPLWSMNLWAWLIVHYSQWSQNNFSMWRARHLSPWSFIMIAVSHLIDRFPRYFHVLLIKSLYFDTFNQFASNAKLTIKNNIQWTKQSSTTEENDDHKNDLWIHSKWNLTSKRIGRRSDWIIFVGRLIAKLICIANKFHFHLRLVLS